MYRFCFEANQIFSGRSGKAYSAKAIYQTGTHVPLFISLSRDGVIATGDNESKSLTRILHEARFAHRSVS